MKMDSLHNAVILEDELLPLLRERLAAGQSVRYLPFRGVSMLPMLRQGKDMVELSPLPDKLQKYDLPVYQYPTGKIVMHRIVAVQENRYICLGDNTYAYEYIQPEWMIGVVRAFKRGDRRISVDDPAYRLYSKVWVAIYPIRKVLRRIRNWLAKYLRPVKHWLRRHLK